ncbi:LytTR family DNA-binding domain-containing protein [Winogradskyella alexanderae]|uniref:LytTR family transcriptional regulator n=1 Tax=Winogradskyella alexanderae TaxID=2877123 RepID=A0ABS7XRS1_9FLAO|nr:LytTR family DNA-binding domain-containing protein [Winogradskyella alexanderae]MCA0132725.1 LytTR family transcriptional regulator [Winogradskyella alexanderae]
MRRLYPFDPLFKHHLIIALLLAIWVFVFLYFSEPLDVNQFNANEKLLFLPGYGLLGGLCYLIFVPFQYFLYSKNNAKWTIISELVFLFSFCFVSVVVARIFYLFVVVPNEPNPYTLGYMLKAIYFPAIITILPIILISRFAFGKYHDKRLDDQKIEIKGEGNYEGLRLQLNDLICVKSSDNYIEVYYLSGTYLKKTLIRNKLSVIDEDFEELQRTHRSFLINPYHFQQWKINNGKHILLLSHVIEVPVSKTYLTDVKSVIELTTN